MTSPLRWLPFLTLVSLAACSSDSAMRERETTKAPYLYDDLSRFHRAVTTHSEEAQRFFDQGLVLAWAFNHDEAIRAFGEAARIDPACAMAWWGIALANGPHINNPSLAPDHARAAWEALAKARAAAGGASATERTLIDALTYRYAEVASEDRHPLDETYADAMRTVWRAHPEDADVGTLFAEALMDLQPWDLWTQAGEPKLNTNEIVATLETVLALAPDHPGANHLYIHTIEASLHPEKALPSADRLRTLVPGAGHLVHMPAHIDLRLGHYAQASAANERAIEADKKHRALVPAQGFYHVYMVHNHQFLAFSSMMEGRSAVALEAAHAMVNSVPPAFIEAMGPFIDGLMPLVLHTELRFGRWEDVLREPEFPESLVIANATRHYARGVALAALGRLDEAEREETELAAATEKIDEKAIVGNNPAHLVMEVARNMLAGEIAFRRGRADESFALLRKAAELEDTLRYDEPPDWMMPVRHALGAALVQAKRYEEAERVYREDLRRFPDNGWSLFGLAQCLEAQGKNAEAREARGRFERAWSRADVTLKSSCFCQPGT